MSWARALYSAVVVLLTPLLRLKLRRRARAEALYGQHIPERFGHYQPADLGREHAGRWLWVHAVSLGETRTAALLINVLRRMLPEMRLLLTHGTATGREAGRALLGPGDVQVWQPWDTPAAARRFVQQFRPAIGVLMETEVWPNLIAECERAAVPLILVNARLNERSFARARRFAALSRPAYAGIATVLAQTHADAQRLRTLGARVAGVVGNMKFDQELNFEHMAQGVSWRAASERPVIILASSREDEEAQWLAQWLAQPADGARGMRSVQWLIVPRHPQRFDAVYKMLTDAGVRVARRSQWGERLPPAHADVWLGDSMGEMALYYASAHAGLLGGSFAPLGGQNLIEAAACGCPMWVGPHTFNFQAVAEDGCKAGAAHRAQDMPQAIAEAIALVHDRAAMAAASHRAEAFAQSQRGATLVTAIAIVQMLRTVAPGSVGRHLS